MRRKVGFTGQLPEEELRWAGTGSLGKGCLKSPDMNRRGPWFV